MKNFLRKKMSLSVVLVLFVFFIMLATIMLTSTGMVIVIRHFSVNPFRGPNPFTPILLLFFFSIVLGTALTALLSRRMLRPLRKIIVATQQVAVGDFSVRLDTDNVPELEDLAVSFNTMVQELAGIETLRNDFVSNFSHEFKTPIVSIRGFAKLLRNKNLPEDERDEYIEIIIQESERLAGLATNVLELSKLENSAILADKQHYDLDEQIRRVAAMMEPRWHEKRLSVSLDMEEIAFYGDADLLQQVWVNLLDNAIKFTTEGGSVSLSLTKQGNMAVFRLADDGCGMDEQTLAHIYEKFYQGDSSHSGSGNGLGLALVKQIIQLQDGTIEVHSQPGQGTVFTVCLPVS